MAVSDRQHLQAAAKTRADMASERGTAALGSISPEPAAPAPQEQQASIVDQLAKEATNLRASERPLASVAEARKAIQILESKGAEGLGEERYRNGWDKVKRFIADNPEAIEEIRNGNTQANRDKHREENLRKAREIPSNTEGFASDYLRQLTGLGSASASIINSAAAEPVAGLMGLGALAFGASNDEGVEYMDAWRDAITFVPVTQEGQDMLQTVAAPIQWLDDHAKYASEYVSFGNPYAATAVYTALMEAPDILGLYGGQALRLSKKMRQAEKVAERIGVPPVQQTLPSDIIDAAKNMSSDVAGANAGRLQQAMIDAKAAARQRLEAIKARATEKRAFVNTAQAKEFANDFRKRAIEDGFDLEKMPDVAERLKDLHDLDLAPGARPGAATPQMSLGFEAPTKVRARRVQDWMTVRNRIDKFLETTKDNARIPGSTNERAVMYRLRDEMDSNLQHQFNADMIEGNPESISVWKDYNDARDAFNQTFNADKTIIDLMNSEATPEQIKRWVIGANAANASPRMSAVVNRLKEVLGPRHPAIEGIRQDFLYDIVKPLFQERPSLDGLIRNIDNTLKNNSSVIKALDLDVEAMRAMRNLAKVSLANPPSKVVKLINDMSSALARMSPLAHKLSKAALHVSLLTNLFRKIAGTHHTAKRRILAEFANAQYGGRVVDKGSAAAGSFIGAAALSDIQHILEDGKNEKVEPSK